MSLEERAVTWSLQHLIQSGAFEIYLKCKKKKSSQTTILSKLCRNPFSFHTELKSKVSDSLQEPQGDGKGVEGETLMVERYHGLGTDQIPLFCSMDRNTDRDPQKQLNQKTMNDVTQNSQDGLLVTHVNQTQDLLVTNILL